MKTLIFLLLIAGTAFADDSYSAEDYERKQESIRKDEPRIIPDAPVKVERYSPPDYKNDPEVLISKPREVQLMHDIEKKIVVIKEPVYVVEKPEEEVKVTATYEE